MMRVKLTTLQLEEITHKLSILTCEPDLQESYEISENDAEQLHQRFQQARAGDWVILEPHVVDIIVGEIGNRMDIALSNWKDMNDAHEGGVYRSLHKLVKQLDAQQN